MGNPQNHQNKPTLEQKRQELMEKRREEKKDLFHSQKLKAKEAFLQSGKQEETAQRFKKKKLQTSTGQMFYQIQPLQKMT